MREAHSAYGLACAAVRASGPQHALHLLHEQGRVHGWVRGLQPVAEGLEVRLMAWRDVLGRVWVSQCGELQQLAEPEHHGRGLVCVRAHWLVCVRAHWLAGCGRAWRWVRAWSVACAQHSRRGEIVAPRPQVSSGGLLGCCCWVWMERCSARASARAKTLAATSFFICLPPCCLLIKSP